MIKNSVIALVSAAALAGIAVPAMAASYEPAEDSISSFDADYVKYQLQAQGVNADSVEQWGGYVRAFVIGEDGRQVMQFFDPDTLVQVAL